MARLVIRGMTCEHCIKAVTEALHAVPGVASVDSVDLASGVALVKEGTATPAALISAVEAAGYKARLED